MLSTFAAGFESPTINDNVIKLFPNPASESTNLALNLIEKSNVEVAIYNLLGQNVKSFPAKEYNSGRINETLNLSGLSKGNYFIKIKINDDYLQKKLIIQ